MLSRFLVRALQRLGFNPWAALAKLIMAEVDLFALGLMKQGMVVDARMRTSLTRLEANKHNIHKKQLYRWFVAEPEYQELDYTDYTCHEYPGIVYLKQCSSTSLEAELLLYIRDCTLQACFILLFSWARCKWLTLTMGLLLHFTLTEPVRKSPTKSN